MNAWLIFSIFIVILGTGLRCVAQGRLFFSTSLIGLGVNGQVTYLDGTPVGIGYTAQLYGGPQGAPISELFPLSPTTTFIPSGTQQGYVYPVGIIISGTQNGSYVSILMRAYNGATYETSSCRGESILLDVQLGGGGAPDGMLVGLQPFQVNCVPEPSTPLLLGIGALAILCCRRRRSAVD